MLLTKRKIGWSVAATAVAGLVALSGFYRSEIRDAARAAADRDHAVQSLREAESRINKVKDELDERERETMRLLNREKEITSDASRMRDGDGGVDVDGVREFARKHGSRDDRDRDDDAARSDDAPVPDTRERGERR